jgi:hypothetical protein
MADTSQVPETTLDAVVREVCDLQRRVAALELRAGITAAQAPAALLVSASGEPDTSSEAGFTLIPTIGKALLGLSAAYLLRALVEMAVLPVAVGVAAGIVYAVAWLVLAARAAPKAPVTAAIHSLTSVLILLPLLWEAALRFHVASNWVVAGTLLVFSVFGLAISWRNNLSMIAWITTLAGLMGAIGLLVATHDLLPFTCMLLALAAAVEISACFEHWVNERWIVAAGADLAVLITTLLVTRPAGLPQGYFPIGRAEVIGLQIALLGIYLSGMIVRTLWRKFTVTPFEIVQCVIAFGIATAGALRVAQDGATLAVALFSAIACVACYAVSFVTLEHRHQDRNFFTYGTFGLALALIAAFLLLSGFERSVVLCALGAASIYVGKQSDRMTLKWHGCVFLFAAAVDSGLVAHALNRFAAGSLHAQRSLTLPQSALSTIAALACFWWILRGRAPAGAARNFGILVATTGALAALNVAAVSAGLLLGRCNGSGTIEYCATELTAILTALAMVLAAISAYRGIKELAWPAYAAMGLATVKLLTQDFRQAHALSLVFSLLIYGTALILLPRILKAAPRTRA